MPLVSFLLSLSIIVAVTIMADLLYSPKKIVKRGYEVQISSSGKVVKKEEKIIDIAVLLKTANVENGAKIFKKCSSCHNAENGAGNKIGPNLYGVVGRKKASFSSFSYSEAMLKKGGSWNYQDLNQFLTKPKEFVSGTKMGFAGLKKAQDRADVIRYLELKK